MKEFFTIVVSLALLGIPLKERVSATEINCTLSGVFGISQVCNNLANPLFGSQRTAYVRHEPVAFADGLSTPREGPNVRTISRIMSPDLKANGAFGNRNHLTLLFVFFGQFLAHDIAATISMNATEDNSHIVFVPIENQTDPFYALSKDSPKSMRVRKSFLELDEGGVGHPVNANTHFIDLTSVYGNTEAFLDKLRSKEKGRMLTGNYVVDGKPFGLPSINLHTQLPNADQIGIDPEPVLSQFMPRSEALIAGDLRVIENPELGMYHLLFLREHNRYAAEFSRRNPDWTDEQIFQAARKWTVATYQNIVFYEFVAATVGPLVFAGAEKYPGYKANVDPRMDVSFVTSAFRFGHSMIPDDIPVLDFATDHVIGDLPVVGLFHGKFNALSANLVTRGPANLAYSLFKFGGRSVDEQVSDTMRSFPDPFDVLAANLMRERLHGLPAYNDLLQSRMPDGEMYNLYGRPGCAAEYEDSDQSDPIECFMGITNNEGHAHKLQEAYAKVKFVDGFMGMVMEHRYHMSALGMMQTRIVMDQFLRSRAGDRWWFENTDNGLFTEQEVTTIKRRTLADVIADNFDIPHAKLSSAVFKNQFTGASIF